MGIIIIMIKINHLIRPSKKIIRFFSFSDYSCILHSSIDAIHTLIPGAHVAVHRQRHPRETSPSGPGAACVMGARVLRRGWRWFIPRVYQHLAHRLGPIQRRRRPGARALGQLRRQDPSELHAPALAPGVRERQRPAVRWLPAAGLQVGDGKEPLRAARREVRQPGPADHRRRRGETAMLSPLAAPSVSR